MIKCKYCNTEMKLIESLEGGNYKYYNCLNSECNGAVTIEEGGIDSWFKVELCSKCNSIMQVNEVYGAVPTEKDGEVYIVDYECNKCGCKELRGKTENE
ncbi:hypothetical protein [uncultured Clostridium sp.]|uniref:hypothetical protein n=1 Tax=uncultured Clostridium sp. TaxID=59620 RepID=UPI00260FB089|nr:hypothetical protein [uncultured Clostridium sp.]